MDPEVGMGTDEISMLVDEVGKVMDDLCTVMEVNFEQWGIDEW